MLTFDLALHRKAGKRVIYDKISLTHDFNAAAMSAKPLYVVPFLSQLNVLKECKTSNSLSQYN